MAAALALFTTVTAIVGQVLLVDDGVDRRFAVSAFLVAAGCWIWFLDLRRERGGPRLSHRVLGSGGCEPRAATGPFRAAWGQWNGAQLSSAAGTWAIEAPHRARAHVASRPVAWAMFASSVVIALGVTLMLHGRRDGNVAHWDALSLWLVSIGLYASAAWPSAPRVSRASVARQMHVHRQAVFDAGALLAFALLLRVPALGSWPPVLSGDEGIVGNLSLEFADGKGTMFGTAWAYSSLVFLAHAPFTILFGGATALRLPDAIIGSFAAPAAYLAGRQLFDRRIGIMAGVIVAALHMHVHLSRIALAHGGDAVLAALVFFTFMRGLDRRDARWMVLAGITLGMSQYGYVGGRIIGLVVAAFVLVQVLLQPAYVLRVWRLIAVALGAALVTAAPMIRLAIDRPADYLSRVQSVGVAQSGLLAEQMGQTGRPMWLQLLYQVREAVLGVLVYPATDFYGATIPLFNLLLAVLLILGVVYALWRSEERRNQLLLLHVGMSLLMLALAKDANTAAYRVSGVAPSAAILAAVALKLLAEGGLKNVGLPARAPSLAMGAAIALCAGHDVGYYFGRHLPECRYTDESTAAASVIAEAAARAIERTPDVTVFLLTEPALRLSAYPSTLYLSGRETMSIPVEAGDDFLAVQLGTEDAGETMYSLGVDNAPSAQLVGSDRPALIIAAPFRAEELGVYASALPGGTRGTLQLCGDVVAETYFVPEDGRAGPG